MSQFSIYPTCSSHNTPQKTVIPAWSVSCRRITPGLGYFEALCSVNVSVFYLPHLFCYRSTECFLRESRLKFLKAADYPLPQTKLETSEIARITPTGVVELRNGQTHKLDVLICATGFDTSFQYPFPVLGRDGRALSERWALAGAGPEAYMSLAVDGFPNLFIGGGPHSAVTSGSLLNVGEHVVGYVVEAVRKMQRERLRSMELRREAMEDWSSYLRVSVFGGPLCSAMLT